MNLPTKPVFVSVIMVVGLLIIISSNVDIFDKLNNAWDKALGYAEEAKDKPFDFVEGVDVESNPALLWRAVAFTEAGDNLRLNCLEGGYCYGVYDYGFVSKIRKFDGGNTWGLYNPDNVRPYDFTSDTIEEDKLHISTFDIDCDSSNCYSVHHCINQIDHECNSDNLKESRLGKVSINTGDVIWGDDGTSKVISSPEDTRLASIDCEEEGENYCFVGGDRYIGKMNKNTGNVDFSKIDGLHDDGKLVKMDCRESSDGYCFVLVYDVEDESWAPDNEAMDGSLIKIEKGDIGNGDIDYEDVRVRLCEGIGSEKPCGGNDDGYTVAFDMECDYDGKCYVPATTSDDDNDDNINSWILTFQKNDITNTQAYKFTFELTQADPEIEKNHYFYRDYMGWDRFKNIVYGISCDQDYCFVTSVGGFVTKFERSNPNHFDKYELEKIANGVPYDIECEKVEHVNTCADPDKPYKWSSCVEKCPSGTFQNETSLKCEVPDACYVAFSGGNTVAISKDF